MKKPLRLCLCLLLSAVTALGSGCSPAGNAAEPEEPQHFSPEYDFRTDYQYSYECSSVISRPIQSDGTGQFINKNGFIFYYRPETGVMTPLCNKPNCLHDQETDWNRVYACNAYASVENRCFMQYYNGYIYAIVNDANRFSDAGEQASLCRIACDGSRKDILYTLGYGAGAWPWAIHRGYLYYCLRNYFTLGEGSQRKVCSRFTMNRVKLSSHMNAEKPEVIYDSGQHHHVYSFPRLIGYKDYILFNVVGNELDFDMERADVAGWYRQLYTPCYIYNTKTGETKAIPLPDGYGAGAVLGNIALLGDQLLVMIYDNLQPQEHLTEIYSMDLDLTESKVWMDHVPQGKYLKCYGDYLIMTDGSLRFDRVTKENGLIGNVLKEGESLYTNIEVFSADARLVAHCVYPKALEFPIGFGPDGVRLETEINEEENTWSVYRLKFDDVLRCHGETLEPELISTKPIGSLFTSWNW